MKIKKILICGLFCLINFIFPEITKAAELYFMPQTGMIFNDETAIIELRLDTGEKPVNAVDAAVKFNTEELEVKDFITGGSAIDLWLEEPHISNSSGIVRFSGGTSKKIFPNNALLGRLIVKPKKTDVARLKYEETSKALKADGFGTPLKLDYSEGVYEIFTRPTDFLWIFSKSHPNSERWYPSNILEINWDAKENAQYSYLISRDSEAQPNEGPESIVGDIEYAGLEDGIYYFHLREKKDGQDWQDMETFRAMIDTSPPEFSAIAISRKKRFFNDEFNLIFNATDNASGIDYYLVCENKKICIEAKNSYVLSDQFFGKEITIKAVDKAGHERQTTTKLPFTFPIYFIAILIFMFVSGAIKIYLKLKQR